MTKINKHIEIVCSSTKELSSMSQESRDAVFDVLSKHYSKVGITIVNNLAQLEALVASKPDLVFLGMKFVPANPSLGLRDPNRIWLAEYLDEYGITYTGSDQTAHELELNKSFAKRRVIDAGLKTASFYTVKQNQFQSESDLKLDFPLFIKPADRGGGLGIDNNSIAHNFGQMQSKVQSISDNFGSDSLVEEYLPGREFSVAILKDENSAEFSVMPIELIAPQDNLGARILSSDVKSSNTEVVLGVTDEVVKAKICALAMNVFQVLGARDYGRIDIRLDKLGVPHFLEANLLPSLISGYGSFPKACEMNLDLDYEPMILTIVRLALARSLDVYDGEPESDIPVGTVGLTLNPALGL